MRSFSEEKEDKGRKKRTRRVKKHEQENGKEKEEKRKRKEDSERRKKHESRMTCHEDKRNKFMKRTPTNSSGVQTSHTQLSVNGLNYFASFASFYSVQVQKESKYKPAPQWLISMADTILLVASVVVRL